jgi:hypothetical protein
MYSHHITSDHITLLLKSERHNSTRSEGVTNYLLRYFVLVYTLESRRTHKLYRHTLASILCHRLLSGGSLDLVYYYPSHFILYKLYNGTKGVPIETSLSLNVLYGPGDVAIVI